MGSPPDKGRGPRSHHGGGSLTRWWNQVWWRAVSGGLWCPSVVKAGSCSTRGGRQRSPATPFEGRLTDGGSHHGEGERCGGGGDSMRFQ
jgi:hypothetical protein